MSIDKYMRALDALCRESAVEEPVAEEAIGFAEPETEPEPDVSLASEIEGASDERWTEFVRRMITAPSDAVSDSNALGMFELSPRRLADFGYVSHLQRAKREAPSGKKRVIWVAKFVAPMTPKLFLGSVRAQYQVFCQSMRDYARRIESGEIDPCDDLTMSGMLAVLHRCGPRGGEIWSRGDRYSDTVELVDRTNEVF